MALMDLGTSNVMETAGKMGLAYLLALPSGWQGERDEERFQAALRDPSGVELATERALRGQTPESEDADGAAAGGRFEREPERAGGGVVLTP